MIADGSLYRPTAFARTDAARPITLTAVPLVSGSDLTSAFNKAASEVRDLPGQARNT